MVASTPSVLTRYHGSYLYSWKNQVNVPSFNPLRYVSICMWMMHNVERLWCVELRPSFT
jgi:hypothetical protein